MADHSHGNVWNASKLAVSLGCSAPTVKRYADLLEDTFVLRQLQPYHSNLKKRLVKSPKIYLRDSGLLHALLGVHSYEELLGMPVAGASFEGWIIEEILKTMPKEWQAYCRGEMPDLPPTQALVFANSKRSVQVQPFSKRIETNQCQS